MIFLKKNFDLVFCFSSAVCTLSLLKHSSLQLLLEAAVKGIPQKVLGSAAYQVANMDVLNVSAVLPLIIIPW